MSSWHGKTAPIMEDNFSTSLIKSLAPSSHTNRPIEEQSSQPKKPKISIGQEDLDHLDLEPHYGINLSRTNVFRNPSVPVLYELALKYEKGTAMSNTGALICSSGERTGRSPKDKRIVDEPSSTNDIWWGPVNIKCEEKTFMINRERAIDYLNTRERIYVVDAYAGWHPKYRLKIRVICARAYHALFMKNMLIEPTREELANFGEPDFTIYNAGEFPANRFTRGMSSSTSVGIHFGRNEMVILGTQYAGEMKKGIFTVMHYYMPKWGLLSLHSSCNVGKDGDVSIFFGLSGTGKTTLSADSKRELVGDDEHVWYDDGVFNIEGGCYAKCIHLSAEHEPEIYQAIRFGSVLENVVYDEITREVDYDNDSITQNTRTSYPISYIPNARIPCLASHPTNIIMLTCDAFGILPPVAILSPEQAMYYFISGYTAKVAGTEVGITKPEATFSACFGDAFLAWHPIVYARMLADKMKKDHTNAWLINTGWVGGSYGVGSRIKLRYTRAIVDAIHAGILAKAPTMKMPVFNLHIPTECPGVPSEILNPRDSWADKNEYDATLAHLARLFQQNFDKFHVESKEIKEAGPQLVKN